MESLTEGLRAPMLTSWSYYAWAIAGAAVVATSLPAIIRGLVDRGRRNGVWLMFVGIFLGWLGSAANKWWFAAWRTFDRPAWMLDHAFVVFYSALVLIGALIHIRTFTVKTTGEIGWIVIALVACIAPVFII